MTALRVQFVHGLEGSPRGSKAIYLAKHFDCITPAMDTSDFEASVEAQARTLQARPVDVLVGSSFGGAVVLELLRRGAWSGPTVLLAPAYRVFGNVRQVPEGVPVTIVHGTRDAVVPIEHSRELARTGSPELVRLLEFDDDHRLRSLVRSGELAGVIREARRSPSP